MATTTHPTPSFDITAADDNMDLHSDQGALEYNDGDIELDLEPPPAYGPDDDVSIDDAVSPSGMDDQAAPSGDNDDYMVDQEDVIEEDYSYQDVDVDTVAEESAAADTVTAEAQAEVQDEDLLDYSEDDDDYHNTALRSPWLQQQDSMQDEPNQTQDIPDQQDEPVQTQDAPTEQGDAPQIQDAPIQQDEIPADLQALMSMNTNKTSQSPQAHADVVADDSLKTENHENSPRPQSAVPTEGDGQTNDDDGGGILLQDQEEHATPQSSHNEMANPSHDYDESAQDGEHEENASFQLPPVIVNCMGEELWLFKQHDYENRGDWLLEDASVATTSMSALFQACRLALNDDVLNGMEIGFRFDHFQNMDLFEESTASVAVSLERLVGYYHILHEQDGNNEPDSFYITLMYRPRFATLLADIARYADSGRGYSGLEAAIAAGETNFNSTSLGVPGEETTEWEAEQQEQQQQQVDDDEHEHEHENETGPENEHEEEHEDEHEQERSASEQTNEESVDDVEHTEDPNEHEGVDGQVQQDAEVRARVGDELEPEEQEQQTYEDAQAQENHGYGSYQDEGDDTQDAHEEGGVDVYENEGVATEGAHGEDDEENSAEDQTQQPISLDDVSAKAPEVADHSDQTKSRSEERTAAELEARRLQEEGDIIDYSDGEDEEAVPVEEAAQPPHSDLSPSPATVQGDESTSVEKQLSVAGSPSAGKQTSGDDGAASFDTTEDPNADAEQDFVGDANGDDDYWAYVEAYEEGSRSNWSHGEEVGQDGAALEHQGDANQDYEGYEYQDLEQQVEVELEFTNGEDFDGGENAATDGDEFSGANDVLDLDNAQWAVDHEAEDVGEKTATAHEDEHIDAQDEEDGIAGQVASATSWAADPTTASSTDAHGVSPQGHKRSIDEAGHGVDHAPDSIDAKRARV